ncbi:hypothetical protein EVAR_34149_1 [Eumeta japonica]|uniref:Uncharacterized protein n=1 Tax=Eumeta variegata TaxID=151549 RepID=A0A4C1ZZV0_EUMVA|nr:hypothetical protein EVAR_34149_1 [Eumeta japonica]
MRFCGRIILAFAKSIKSQDALCVPYSVDVEHSAAAARQLCGGRCCPRGGAGSGGRGRICVCSAPKS